MFTSVCIIFNLTSNILWTLLVHEMISHCQNHLYRIYATTYKLSGLIWKKAPTEYNAYTIHCFDQNWRKLNIFRLFVDSFMNGIVFIASSGHVTGCYRKERKETFNHTREICNGTREKHSAKCWMSNWIVSKETVYLNLLLIHKTSFARTINHDFIFKSGIYYPTSHDDVIKWKHFPRYWPFVWGIHRDRWIPRTKASDAELWCFLWSAPE